MFDYLIVAVLVLWSAIVVFKRYFLKRPLQYFLHYQSSVNAWVGSVWHHG